MGKGFTMMIVLPWCGVNEAFNALIYRDEILQHHNVPPINVTGGIFQHDKARPHIARFCRDFLQQNNVHVLPWPARSADLSPIKTPGVRQRNTSHKNHRICSLIYRMNGETIQQRTIQNVVAFMRAVVVAEPGHNLY